MRRFQLSVAALAIAASASVAQAQGAHKGFTASLGLGSGSAASSCDGCDTSRESALSGYLRLGGALRPNLVVGGEANGWTKDQDGVKGTLSFVSAFAQYYPMATTGFFVKGGAGVGMSKFTGGGSELKATGPAVNLGLGYDFKMGASGLALSPYANYLRNFSAKAKIDGQDAGGDMNVNLIQVGLGLSWH